MAIQDHVIDSVKVEPGRCKEVGYLEAMQRCLNMKHHREISGMENEVQFYLQVASGMNAPAKKGK